MPHRRATGNLFRRALNRPQVGSNTKLNAKMIFLPTKPFSKFCLVLWPNTRNANQLQHFVCVWSCMPRVVSQKIPTLKTYYRSTSNKYCWTCCLWDFFFFFSFPSKAVIQLSLETLKNPDFLKENIIRIVFVCLFTEVII